MQNDQHLRTLNRMNKLQQLERLIEAKVFVQNKNEPIANHVDPEGWIFDFRRILMRGSSANLVADIFFEHFKDRYPFQLGALEIAGVPLVTSLMNKFYTKGHEDINAFFIRKSRKKTGLLRMIEGEVMDQPRTIILVDDIINSGNSFWRQIEILEELGYKVDTVWSILRFRDNDHYTRFYNRGISVESLFELDVFTNALGERIHNLPPKSETVTPMPFKAEWVFRSKNPSLEWVVAKSQPTLDTQKIYFGADNRTFWAVNQSDGAVAWQYEVGRRSKKKAIFSNPALYHHSVIFGAYDGNVYSLDARTGAPQWIFMEADWVGSSPAIAPELELVFIGLEYGLIGKRGAVVALDVHTGKPVWIDRSHQGLTHGTPYYLTSQQAVAIGSNDGKVRLHDARSGEKLWTFTTFGGAQGNNVEVTGFGAGDIKESFAYSSEHDYLMFGSVDSFFYILKRDTGHLVAHFKCDFGIYSTPHLHQNKVYFTSTDKHIRCVNLDTLELVFARNVDNTRIFSSPTVINNRLYVGTNAGRLHELDPETGEQLGYFQTLERITNSVVHNATSDKYFLPTFANEIIALKRISDDTETKGSQE